MLTCQNENLNLSILVSLLSMTNDYFDKKDEWIFKIRNYFFIFKDNQIFIYLSTGSDMS